MDKVSVIIPAYNMANTLSRAISSVFRQSYQNVELVVVNDGSTDDTEEVVNEFDGIIYISREHGGRSAALNTGIEASTGDLLTFLDADDELTPDGIASRVEYLRQHPEKDAVAGNTVYLENGRFKLTRKPGSFFEKDNLALRFFCVLPIPFHTISLMYRRAVFSHIGKFDERRIRSQDYDIAYRLLKNCRVGHVESPVYNYHMHLQPTGQKLKHSFQGLIHRLKIAREYGGRERFIMYASVLVADSFRLFKTLIKNIIRDIDNLHK